MIPRTLPVWCRDDLSVPTARGRFVQFRYEPDYLDGQYRDLGADGQVGPRLPWTGGCTRSEFVLDVGNVVAWGYRAIASDKVFRKNSGMGREGLADRLGRKLGLAEMIIAMREPYDPIGHVDGMVGWLDRQRILT